MRGGSRPRTFSITVSRSARVDALLYGLAALISALAGAISHDVIGRSLRIPMVYKGDALFYGAAFKGTIDNGWYETNPDLNAPTGQSQHDFPQADNLQYVFAKVFDVFSDDWALAFNVSYLLTFPLAALTGVWFFRLVGCSRTSSLVMGCLFAVAPYHFFHGISHLALSMYFVLPLGVGLCFLAFTDRPVVTRREGGSWRNPVTWATRRNGAVVAVLVLLGSTSSYYSVFTLMLFAGTALVLLIRRRWASAVGSMAVMVVLMAVMLINMAPDLWYARTGSANLTTFQRLPIESEIFATKLSWLVLPTHWNRVGSLGQWRLEQDATFPLPGEPTALGVVAAVGFLVLLLLPAMRIALRRGPVTTSSPTADRAVSTYDALGTLSVFNLAAFLFATVGGFATLFALLVTPSIRSWSRLAILLALLGLAAVGLLLDSGIRRHLAPRVSGLGARQRAAALAVPAVLVLGIGLFDQMPNDDWTGTGDVREQFLSDASYGDAVEDAVPADGIVLQLPFMAFPESESINDITDYDPLRGFLHTSSVRWTYAGVKGSVRSAWTERLTSRPTKQWVLGASAAGVEGIHLDRFGYADDDARALESRLDKLVGPATAVSPDGRFVFYDMSELNERMADALGTARLATLRRLVVASTGLVWPDDFNTPVLEGPLLVARSNSTTPVVNVGNPSATPSRLQLDFVVRAEGAVEDHRIAISWPDSTTSEVVAPPGDGIAVSRTVTVPPGTSTMGFSTGGGSSVTLISPTYSDPDLSAALADAARKLRRRR